MPVQQPKDTAITKDTAISVHNITYLHIFSEYRQNTCNTCKYLHFILRHFWRILSRNTCTYLHIPANTFTYMHIPAHTCTNMHIPAHRDAAWTDAARKIRSWSGTGGPNKVDGHMPWDALSGAHLVLGPKKVLWVSDGDHRPHASQSLSGGVFE